MSLTLGTGPFGQAPAGSFSIPLPDTGWLYLEPSPRRIRGLVGNQLVVDSHRPMLLFQPGRTVRHYFPLADLCTGTLQPSTHRSVSDIKGPATHFDLQVGGRFVGNAAWAYRAVGRDPDLSPYVAFYMRAMDSWWEEDLEIHGHARDPYHRVDAVPSSRHVRVSLGGHVLAESERAVVIFETSLPPRWYLPRNDVRAELTASELRTRCTFKGEARYWTVHADGTQARASVSHPTTGPAASPTSTASSTGSATTN
jgi:uncharacterized protein (DUF427 family)